MARRPRICIPGLTQHVVQRGNNKGTGFGESARCAVAIHAYALMTNHFHLMATPSDQTGVSTMMQSVGRNYVPAFNLKHHRTGGPMGGALQEFRDRK
jgi:REP-associated tyrosine transposase